MMKITEKRSKIRGGKKEHDSLFVTVHYEPESFKEALQLDNFETHVDKLDKESERILAAAGLWPHSNPKFPRIRAAIETQKAARENSPEYFAAGVIWWICNLRDALARKNSLEAADAGYRIADNVNKALMASMELATVVGNKSLRGGSNKTNERRRAEAIERDAPLLDIVTRKKATNRAETYGSLARLTNASVKRKAESQLKRIYRARTRASKP